MKKPAFIFSDGDLKRKDNTIFFENEEGQKFIPVENTSEIYIFGEVNINKRFLEFLTQAEIPLHFFNHFDYYIGTFYPREHLNSGYMILKQAEHYLNEDKRRAIAAEFVMGASKNIQQVIRYYINRGTALGEIENSIKNLEEKIYACSNIEELMAIEGNTRDYYYQAFDGILENEDFKFEQRTRRPPQNYLNSLISFGNSMMYTITLSEIYKTHLDPRIGYLHATNFRRFTLNLDVSEIFKPIIVDRVIFTLIGKNMITKNDFDKSSQGLVLKENARKTFIEELQNKLNTTFNHRNLGRNVSYRRLIRLELYKLEKHLIEEKNYKAFVAKW